MIHIQTKLKIKDNTGVKIGQCIKIYKKATGTIGDTILISVKNLRLNKKKKIKITKGDLLKALIIQTKYSVKNTIGNYIKFDNNCAVILNNQNKLMGTRILGPITSEFRKKKQFKILSLASNIL
ncbi:ribosomal protein L14 (mitochondrion) [Saprolegnia parasitica CBS 223.65]|uniref:Ribosomal protein L14 n=2 Tax=Saprolegnia TaxID=4769 RepID=A0A067BG52_SAPPC|nr:ribosomal protein L14 [Saprolegnia ferax]XP_012213610.1 ribosomal protein L14 [Saprolegnia parasitica CBS 223.65]AAT40647.1 ribosomal protein L14 [Saprolegnia ferax]KDO15680.1 ribosomal protein L14 [Saprolegnia parasitica CBS 223.65]|eukprot:XP_012213610.1 ribosomal protein L14 (mitochondrion) [Saprolegnia parasitica CBS 223.65]